MHNQVMTLLNGSDQFSVYTGLLAMYALARRYEYDQDEDRVSFYQISSDIFNILGILTNNLIKNKE